MAKRKFKSYADCESAYEQSAKDAHLSAMALNAELRGAVHWIRGNYAGYRAGVVNPAGADGGIVIVVYSHPGQSDYASAHYIDEWTADRHSEAIDADGAKFRELQFAVLRYRNAAVEADTRRAVA